MSVEDLPIGSDGLPILPAQAAVGLGRVTNDEGEITHENVILPNMIFFFERHLGVLIGDSFITSPQFSARYVEKDLQERAEHVTGCDCQLHDGLTMEVLDPDAVYG